MSLVLLTLSPHFQQGRPVIPHTQPPNIQTEQPSRRSASWYDQDHLEIRELDTTLQCHCDGKMGLHDEKLSKQPMKTVILCKYNTYLYIIYASESHLYIRIVWLYMMHRIYSYIYIYIYPYSICILFTSKSINTVYPRDSEQGLTAPTYL